MESVLFGLGKFILAWVGAWLVRVLVTPFTHIPRELEEWNKGYVRNGAMRGMVFGSSFVGALWWLSRY